MSETFFRTETARADRKNTLLFVFLGGGINFFFLLLCGFGKNFRGGVMLLSDEQKLNVFVRKEIKYPKMENNCPLFVEKKKKKTLVFTKEGQLFAECF